MVTILRERSQCKVYAVIANNNADEISQQISNNEVMHLREQNKTDQQNAAGISRICMLVLIFVFVFFGQPVGPRAWSKEGPR